MPLFGPATDTLPTLFGSNWNQPVRVSRVVVVSVDIAVRYLKLSVSVAPEEVISTSRYSIWSICEGKPGNFLLVPMPPPAVPPPVSPLNSSTIMLYGLPVMGSLYVLSPWARRPHHAEPAPLSGAQVMGS